MAASESYPPVAQKAIHEEAGYFEKHRAHMNYDEVAASGLPIGSGSMESQCGEYQGRLKRRGQFRQDEGFAALLEVKNRYQNGELDSLWDLKCA